MGTIKVVKLKHFLPGILFAWFNFSILYASKVIIQLYELSYPTNIEKCMYTKLTSDYKSVQMEELSVLLTAKSCPKGKKPPA